MKRINISISISITVLLLTCLPDLSHGQVQSFEFEGLTRQYDVHLPQDFQPNMPVILALHGWTVDFDWMKNRIPFHEVTDTSGIITVYPNGINSAWHTFPGCDPWGDIDTTINDVGFLSALIDTLKANYDIDLNRVYCCGHSMGGTLTYKFTTQLGQRLAAIAAVGSPMWDFIPRGLAPVRSLPVIHMHGTGDGTALWDGQPDCENLWGAEETVNFWVRNDSCLLNPDTVFLPDVVTTDNCTAQKITYADCSGEGKVVFYKLINHSHGWPGSELFNGVCMDIDAIVEIVDFFKQYDNPLAGMAYGNGMEISSRFVQPLEDTLTVNARFVNPNQDELEVYAKIRGMTPGFHDSIQMFDDGAHGDGGSNDHIYGCNWMAGEGEENYSVTYIVYNHTYNTRQEFYWPEIATNIGPVQLANPPYIKERYLAAINAQELTLVYQNDSKLHTITGVKPVVTTEDPRVQIDFFGANSVDLAPGESASRAKLTFNYLGDVIPDSLIGNPIHFDVEFTGNGSAYWSSSFTFEPETVTTSIGISGSSASLLQVYQNHPNPFQGETYFDIELRTQQYLSLDVYNIMGQCVLKLDKGILPAGVHSICINGTVLAEGVYSVVVRSNDNMVTRRVIKN